MKCQPRFIDFIVGTLQNFIMIASITYALETHKQGGSRLSLPTC